MKIYFASFPQILIYSDILVLVLCLNHIAKAIQLLVVDELES